MGFRVGIGIVTYNRAALVDSVVDRVLALTREKDAAFVVAVDGSTDGTLEMLRHKQVPVVAGINMGIAWNKNRALFLLAQILGCESVILLEDDTQPAIDGWESQWITATQHWGHVNYAGEWMREYFLSGTGTADDPVESTMVTAQCAGYSRRALTYGGYFDSRFKGHGHGHVEHTRRLIRVGFGGTDHEHDGKEQVRFKMIAGGVRILPSESYHRAEMSEQNLRLAQRIMGLQDYRMPWANDLELCQFRAEMDSALCDGEERFRLHRAATDNNRVSLGEGFFRRGSRLGRLFGRA